MNEPFIVAEISKNWLGGKSKTALLLAEQFERLINANWGRGYRLVSWKLNRIFLTPTEMNETIIAVFERRTDGPGEPA